MHKKMITIFGLLSLVAVGAVGLAVSPISVVGGGLAEGAEGLIKNYEQTFTELVPHGNVWGIETDNGNFIEVNTTGTQQEGLVTLNKGDYFDLATPIGGIWGLELNLKVDGQNYDPSGAAVLNLDFGYYTNPENFNSNVILINAGKEFKNAYNWGSGYAYQTPSLLSLKSIADNVVITGMTLRYNCLHLGSEALSEQGAIYALGTGAQNTYVGNTATGVKCVDNGTNEVKVTLNLEKGQEVYFRKPFGEVLSLVMPEQGTYEAAVAAIDLGYISYDSTTNKFTCLKDGQVSFFIKTDTYLTYAVIPGESLYDWYLTGQGFKIGTVDCTAEGTNCWGNTDTSYKLDKKGQNLFTARNVEFKEGSEFKIFRLKDTNKKEEYDKWVGYQSICGGFELVTASGNDNTNIKVTTAGVYDITFVTNQDGFCIRIYDVTQD